MSIPCSDNNYIDQDLSQKKQEIEISRLEEQVNQNLEILGELDQDDPTVKEICDQLLDGINLSNLKLDIIKCSKCKLRSSATLPVPFSGGYGTTGEGYNGLGVIGITNAPKMSEDKLGDLLAGESGKLLNKTLNLCKPPLRLDAMVSVCCCRTPQDREPSDKEIKECRKNLIAQLDYLQPWLILGFGATPLKILRPDFRITIDHGVVFPTIWPELKRVIWSYGVYHPNFVLRKAQQKDDHEAKLIIKEFAQDLQHISAIVECRKVLGADIFNPLMNHMRKSAPYISKDPEKTKELRTTYLDRMEKDDEEHNNPEDIPF